VGIDFLAHYSEPSFSSDASAVVDSADLLAVPDVAAFGAPEAVVAGAFVAGASAAALDAVRDVASVAAPAAFFDAAALLP
jgi:hypothetical protein